ncbi:tetratricopeptide repeat protein, partial [bacterium]|nr:tetratricopeptide repeat protein [candidate division CSSED10-310 bacterium]
ILGVVLCIAPVSIRNLAVEGEWVTISSHGGINFFIGNNPTSDGHTAAAPMKIQYGEHYEDNVLISAKQIAESAEGRALSGSEISRFWYRESYRYILSNPLDWLKLIAKKLVLSVNATEITNYRDMLFFAKTAAPVLNLLFNSTLFIIPLGVTGMVIAWPKRKEWGALYALCWATLAVLLIFFVTARYRVIMMPALLIFTGLSLFAMERWLRNRKFTPLGISILSVAALLAVGQLNIDGIKDLKPEGSLNLIGKLYIKKGNLKEAEAYISKALEINPDLEDPYGDAWVNLGRLRFHLGNYDEALTAYETALKRNPSSQEIQQETELVRKKIHEPAQTKTD